MLHYSYVWAHFFRILEAGQSPNTTSTFLSDIDKHRAGVLLLQICFEILPKTILKSFNIWKTSIHILISCLNGASLFSYRERGITYSDKGRWIGRHCPMCAEHFSNMAASSSCFHCTLQLLLSRAKICHHPSSPCSPLTQLLAVPKFALTHAQKILRY